MVGKADTSTAVDWTRAVLLSMPAVKSGLGGGRGLDVWLLDRSGGLCVHKTVVRETVGEEMTEPATWVSRMKFGRPGSLLLCLVEVVVQFQSTCWRRGKSTAVTPAQVLLFRHCGETQNTFTMFTTQAFRLYTLVI
jgi:hypothetical protein